MYAIEVGEIGAVHRGALFIPKFHSPLSFRKEMLNLQVENENVSKVEGKKENQEMIPVDERPSFVKNIGLIEHCEMMMIPTQFVEKLGEELRARATLKVYSGSSWKVEVLEKKGAVFFRKGWKEFLQDNSLGNKEILLFRYDGDMCFYVQYFDTNGCRVDQQSRNSYPTTAEIGPALLPSITFRFDQNGNPYQVFPGEIPFFTSTLTKANVDNTHLLYIPTPFGRTHLSSTNSLMKLINSQGATWPVKHIRYGGRHFFCGGWSKFALANELKAGEVCMFHLIAEDTMEVQILPPFK